MFGERWRWGVLVYYLQGRPSVGPGRLPSGWRVGAALALVIEDELYI